MRESVIESNKGSDLVEVRKNVAKIEDFCNKEGLPFKKPLIILGTFERVGSNWLLDTLSQHVHTHTMNRLSNN